jgi:hypothetical protein
MIKGKKKVSIIKREILRREREIWKTFKSLTVATTTTYLKLVMCTFLGMLVSEACGHIYIA